MLWLIFPSLAIVFGAGLLLALLRGKWKPAGALYLFLIPILFAVSARAQAVDFRQLTDARAAQTSSAVDSYHAREGHYPQELGQLFPRDALSLGGPVILYGQDWCYDGGRDYYRLGYVYHEHWSDPRLFGQLYKSQGQTPELPPLCAAEISALAKRYPFFTARR